MLIVFVSRGDIFTGSLLIFLFMILIEPRLAGYIVVTCHEAEMLQVKSTFFKKNEVLKSGPRLTTPDFVLIFA